MLEITIEINNIGKKLQKYSPYNLFDENFGTIDEVWKKNNGKELDVSYDLNSITYVLYNDISYKEIKSRFKSITDVYLYICNDFKFDFKSIVPKTLISKIVVRVEENDDEKAFSIDSYNNIEELDGRTEFDIELEKNEQDSINVTYDNIEVKISQDDLLTEKERINILKKVHKLNKQIFQNVYKMRKHFHLSHDVVRMKQFTRERLNIEMERLTLLSKIEKDIDLIRLLAIKKYFDKNKNLYREEAINKTYSIGYYGILHADHTFFFQYYKYVKWLFDVELFYKHLNNNEKLPKVISGCTFRKFEDVKEMYFSMVKKFPLSPNTMECVIDRKYNKGLFE